MSTAKLKEAMGVKTPEGKELIAQSREITPYEKFRNFITGPQMKADLKILLGTDKVVDTFIRVVLTAVQQTPDLLNADRRTLLLACMKSAQDGLMPDGREAVFNIYNTKQKRPGGDVWVPAVQYLPMSGGLIKKLWDTGLLDYLDAAAVYEKDRFLFTRGLDVKLEHEPYLGDGERGPVVAAYCVVRLKGSTLPKLEVMGRHDLDSVKNASKSAEKGPWATWPGEMAIKSVIKRIYKQLPHTAEVDKLVASDNDAMGFTQMAGASAIGDLHAEHPGAERPVVEVPPPALPDNPSPVAGFTHIDVLAKLEAAKNLDELAIAADLIGSLPEGEGRDAAAARYKARVEEFTSTT